MDNRFDSNLPQGSGNKNSGQFKGTIKNLADKNMPDKLMNGAKDKLNRAAKEPGEIISKGKEMIQEKLGTIDAEKVGTFLKSNWKPVVGGAALLGVAVAGVIALVGRSAAKLAD